MSVQEAGEMVGAGWVQRLQVAAHQLLELIQLSWSGAEQSKSIRTP